MGHEARPFAFGTCHAFLGTFVAHAAAAAAAIAAGVGGADGVGGAGDFVICRAVRCQRHCVNAKLQFLCVCVCCCGSVCVCVCK